MLQGGHSAILLAFIKLPFCIKIFVLSIFEWRLKTGFTVLFSFDSWCSQYGHPVTCFKSILPTVVTIVLPMRDEEMNSFGFCPRDKGTSIISCIYSSKK